MGSGAHDGRKVGVVGVGAVGQACAFALADKAAQRATAAATDMRYGAPLSPTVEITGGDWSDLAGASVVLICADRDAARTTGLLQ
jgi:L-lactate dehydrogenase